MLQLTAAVVSSRSVQSVCFRDTGGRQLKQLIVDESGVYDVYVMGFVTDAVEVVRSWSFTGGQLITVEVVPQGTGDYTWEVDAEFLFRSVVHSLHPDMDVCLKLFKID